MKTTFAIADNIMARSKVVARREHVALKELVEEGLLMVIAKHETKDRRRVEPVTFKGNGFSTEFKGRAWSEVRNAAYEGRGA